MKRASVALHVSKRTFVRREPMLGSQLNYGVQRTLREFFRSNLFQRKKYRTNLVDRRRNVLGLHNVSGSLELPSSSARKSVRRCSSFRGT